MNFISLFLAILAGGLGAALRYVGTVAVPVKKDGFPWAIFIVNAVGSLLVGEGLETDGELVDSAVGDEFEEFVPALRF